MGFDIQVDGVSVLGGANPGPRLLEAVGFAALPAGWSIMGPANPNLLTRAQALTFAAGGVTLKTDHSWSGWSNDDPTAPIGLSRPHDSNQFDVNIHCDNLADQSELVGDVFWWMFFGQVWGEPGTRGNYCGIFFNYRNAAAETGPDPGWYAEKVYKHQNVVSDTQSDKIVIQESKAPAPSDVHLRFEWDEEQGFKVYWSSDPAGPGWTEVGGGAVATGFIDPHRSNTELTNAEALPPGARQKRLIIAAGQNFNTPGPNHPAVRVRGLNVDAST